MKMLIQYEVNVSHEDIHIDGGGNVYIHSQIIENPGADLIKLISEKYGVSFRAVQSYLNYMKTQQCTGKTRKGFQCLKHGVSYPCLSNFIPGETDRCHHHINLQERLDNTNKVL